MKISQNIKNRKILKGFVITLVVIIAVPSLIFVAPSQAHAGIFGSITNWIKDRACSSNAWSCTGSSASATPTATITQTSPSTIDGKPFTISWNSTNAQSCAVTVTDQKGNIWRSSLWGGGSFGPLWSVLWDSTMWGGPKSSGSKTDIGRTYNSTILTYTYKNTCTGAGGTAVATLTHKIKPLPPPPSPTPSPSQTPTGKISASPNPCKIPVGSSVCTSTLTWSASSNAGFIQIKTKSGSTLASYTKHSGNLALNNVDTTARSIQLWGQYPISKTHPGKYVSAGYIGFNVPEKALLGTISVKGTATQPIPVPTPKPAPTPKPTPTPKPSIIFSSPNTVSSGQSAILRWSSTHATSCTGAGFSTKNKTIGTKTVIPTDKVSKYMITCSGPGGKATSYTTINVLVPAIKSLTASPTRILPNGYSVIKWEVLNVKSCTISGPGLPIKTLKGLGLKSSQKVINITHKSTYTLSCPTPTSTLTKSVIVKVNPKYKLF